MKQWRCLLTAVTCAAVMWLAVPGARADDDAQPQPGQQQPQTLERTVKVTLRYLLYLPADYAQQESWPLLLFLHGAGERGADLQRVQVHGPPKLIAEGKQFPLIVVSPQCPSGEWWQPHALAALLDEVAEKYKVDLDRVYVTGLSMGGYGTWSLAAFAPDRFAALVPICGGGDARSVRRFPQVPVWVFHGAKDSVVPLSASEEMVAALRQLNNPVKFTVYPEADHDSWTQAYNDPELYQWLLEQTRAARSAVPAQR